MEAESKILNLLMNGFIKLHKSVEQCLTQKTIFLIKALNTMQ